MKKILTALLLFPTLCFSQTAYDIIKKSDEHIRGYSNHAELSIEVIRPKWSRTIEVKTWSLGNEYSMILLLAPARDKGSVFLKRETEIWNWQPKIEKIIKLPPSMMMQSWMGSDFTNDDLIKESSVLKDYNHSLIGDTLIQNRDCYIIELIPKPEAAIVWGKIHSYIDKKDFLQLESRFYDEDGYLINKMEASEIKNLGGRLLPSIMVMTPVEEDGQQTTLRYKSIEFDLPLEASFFSKQNMKRLR